MLTLCTKMVKVVQHPLNIRMLALWPRECIQCTVDLDWASGHNGHLHSHLFQMRTSEGCVLTNHLNAESHSSFCTTDGPLWLEASHALRDGWQDSSETSQYCSVYLQRGAQSSKAEADFPFQPSFLFSSSSFHFYTNPTLDCYSTRTTGRQKHVGDHL